MGTKGLIPKSILMLLVTPDTMLVYAKPLLSQVNVRQNLSATGRNFGFTCRKDRQLL